ncbi:hypothetical protein AB0M28_13420 [Streptomyces sp. NPDC051940]|uniref:phage tail tube protein n=1 Tax=Streptomyces sp. NPDC051940 TaxID=3155675 RepID=UPI00343203BE
MAATQYNARDCVFQIENPASPGTWVDIGAGRDGIMTFSVGRKTESTDMTDFASGGQEESQVMQRGKTLKLEGKRLKDVATGVLDAGQQLVETLADQVGDASWGRVRFASPGDTTYAVWTATAEMGEEGGGNNDKVSWSVTFTRSGAATTLPRP